MAQRIIKICSEWPNFKASDIQWIELDITQLKVARKKILF